MFQVVGITRHHSDVGFVLWNEELSVPSFVDTLLFSSLLRANVPFTNAALLDGKITALGVTFDKMPVYEIDGRYLGSQPVFTIMSETNEGYYVLSNTFSLDLVPKGKIVALLLKDSSYVCNAELVNGKVKLLEPKHMPDISNVESSSQKLAKSGIVYLGTPVAYEPCIESRMSVIMNSQTAINAFNAIGDLFIDTYGVGAWCYKGFKVNFVVQSSASALLIKDIKIEGIKDNLKDITKPEERQFHEQAIDRISDINYMNFISTLMPEDYYTPNDLQMALWDVIDKLCTNVVRVSSSGILGPINLEKTLANFAEDSQLRSLRAAGFKK